ncbi:protease inhibitor I42 family protein [Actinoplanes sp. NPDC026619]|uniref:protease inhibitor I42 family protein n=1 Tax=Actinoplanes sp. NPDC026619 TaxID=3155798 RepID=UPI003406C100
MSRFARIVLWVIVIVIVLAGAGWGGVSLYRHQVYGTVYSESELSVTVDKGGRFSLAVPDRGGSVGDAWTAQADAGGLLSAQGRRTRPDALVERVRDPLLGGGQGTTFFTYEAPKAGATSVALSYCFQSCDNPATQDQRRTVTWQVTVR